ncbi:MAG: hypothetical protein ABI925_11360 [Verrucomicrobiota bacterium]
MKNRKLLVRVSCSKRNFYLMPLTDRRPHYYVHFAPPRWVREKIGREEVTRSTGTSELEPAKRIAAQIIESFWLDAGASADAKGLTTQSDVAKLEEILSRYQPLPQNVSPTAAVANRAAMRRLVREGAGIEPTKATVAVFKDAKIIKEYQLARQKAAGSLNLVKQQSAEVSANAVVRRARSIFGRDHLHFYEGLNLPDLTEFMKARLLNVDGDMSFVPFGPGTVERIERELPAQSRNVQLATLLMLYLGLRNCEVEFAKWEWFQRFPDGTGTLMIERRPYFKVKNRSVRTLEMDIDLVAKLAPFWGPPDEWLIVAPNDTERKKVTHRDINSWLRTIIAARTKCAYELRKHAGSVILTRSESDGGGLACAARFLGDTIGTTEKHYARFLKPVHAVRAAELTQKFQVVRTAA